MLCRRALLSRVGCGLGAQAHCSSSSDDSAPSIPRVRPPKVNPFLPKVQTFHGLKADFKHARRMVEGRGVETVHNTLLYRQYGVVVHGGGFLYPSHFDYMRNIINRHMNRSRFAVWRVEDPWLARTKKKAGSRMGGGRGNIKWYVTPVRTGRVVLEVGGLLHEPQARAFLAEVAGGLPMEASFVTQADMEKEEARNAYVHSHNINPYDWDFAVKWNLQNCNSWLTMYERAYKGKSRM